jgi:prepilin peptidase CpaA
MKLVVFLLILLQLIVVSWLDLKHGKIRNYWLLLNLILVPVFYLLMPQLYNLNWSALIFPGLMLMAGFLLYTLNIMGAGDSKYLAALFLLIPVELHWAFMEKLIVSTLAVALLLLSFKLFSRFSEIKAYLVSHHWEGIVRIVRSRFSFAPVILLAWIIFGIEKWF